MSKTHEDRLRDLGFPESVIQESVLAEERGLFDMEPSLDLVQRTVERCRALLPKVATTEEKKAAAKIDSVDALILDFIGKVGAAQKADAQLLGALEALPISEAFSEARAEFAQLERLPRDCLATAMFARETKSRPAVMVDNHNVINPSWWNSDSGFRAVRLAFRVVNDIARKNGAPPIAVLMVLRPKVSSYSQDELAALGELVNSATSDIWAMPYEKAGQYKTEDVIVLGKEHVLRLHGGFIRPGDAFRAFYEVNNKLLAHMIRCNIEEATHNAVQLRGFARIHNWKDTKALLEDVIERPAMQLMGQT